MKNVSRIVGLLVLLALALGPSIRPTAATGLRMA
jgi:hypothetical protein